MSPPADAPPSPLLARTAGGDRTALWLPLLRRLTREVPGWVLWKNAESAFHGTGDIDAAAPEEDWPLVERIFCRWAAEAGAGPVVVCRHIPGGLNLVAVPPGGTHLLEMGVKCTRLWRGAPLFGHADLMAHARMDPRGFRRVRPGAEGVYKLLLNGMRRGGAPDWPALRDKDVPALLRADPVGARAAARRFGPFAPAAARLARAVAGDGWDRPSAAALELWAALRALRSPGVALARLRFRRAGGKRCPVLAALLAAHRRIPADRDAWLRDVARTHRVHGAGGG
ncbi:MAG TPA: hypothetical protein VFJ16_19250 [Longimicrobium sp.]|nr:hypothetical protein [Longimicrobium sp.]